MQASTYFGLGDIRTYRLKGQFDVVFSSCTLNHLPPKIRARRFAHLKAATARGGILAVNGFASKPDLAPAPDEYSIESPYRSGELRGYYRDWPTIDFRGFEFDRHFGGIPHRHALDAVTARRPG